MSRGPVSSMHGHEAKRLVGLGASKLLLSTKYSLMIYCIVVCGLGVAVFSRLTRSTDY